MRQVYIVIGTAISLLFAYATYSGRNVTDLVRSGKWNAQGRTAFHK